MGVSNVAGMIIDFLIYLKFQVLMSRLMLSTLKLQKQLWTVSHEPYQSSVSFGQGLNFINLNAAEDPWASPPRVNWRNSSMCVTSGKTPIPEPNIRPRWVTSLTWVNFIVEFLPLVHPDLCQTSVIMVDDFARSPRERIGRGLSEDMTHVGACNY